MKPSIESWIEEAKRECDAERLGMILIHNGVVRKSSKDGRERVKGMRLSYDKDLLEKTVRTFSQREGVEIIKVWINEGELSVGDDIMLVLIGGRFRKDVIPVFEELIEKIKREIVKEEEIPE